MRVSPRGTACQGGRVPPARPVVAGGVAETVVGLPRGVAHARPCRRPGCLWGQQAGERREQPAEPP
jgi:hypothetical protein